MTRKLSLACIWVLALLCYVVPYLFLDRVNAWYGSFLFWTLVGALVIILNLIATRDLRGHDQ
ncbi:hypothetical protein [Castellaniella sp.]|uniref:hypothetical protein n=1 Tax=Castellaniella sp. TaxID=1955812 RepID=UPI002AFEFC3A|nr:hypothetical protein [Castellaniella sp.]